MLYKTVRNPKGTFVMHDELTEVDIQKMKEEIEYRRSVLTPKLKDDLAYARGLGDLSENDEYRSAKRELNRNYSRIRYLEGMIETAVIIKVESDSDRVGLFDKVTVYYEDEDEEETLVIVTTVRRDVLDGYISKDSPVGRALIGHKVGDRVKVIVNPTVNYYITIRALEKGTDDGSIEINSY